MTADAGALESGFLLERVYFGSQSHRILPRTEASMPASRSIEFAWDWRRTQADQFEVLIRVRVGPTSACPEECEVSLCGVFRQRGEAAAVSLAEFVWSNAPAILMPYAREAISSLTGRGYFGAFALPPLNVIGLMRGMDPRAATGARQLATDEEPGVGASSP